jgi:hypothetical protein
MTFDLLAVIQSKTYIMQPFVIDENFWPMLAPPLTTIADSQLPPI